MSTGLSGIIEYIASLERPGGGLVASQAHRQDLIVGFPAQTSIYYTTGPSSSQYAMIVYNYMFGSMTPTAFSYTLNYTGWWVSNGILTEDMLSKNIDFFMVVTNANPINVSITNRDVVEHQWEANMYYLTVGTKDDLTHIAHAVRDKGYGEEYMRQILKALSPDAPEYNPEPSIQPLYTG